MKFEEKIRRIRRNEKDEKWTYIQKEMKLDLLSKDYHLFSTKVSLRTFGRVTIGNNTRQKRKKESIESSTL